MLGFVQRDLYYIRRDVWVLVDEALHCRGMCWYESSTTQHTGKYRLVGPNVRSAIVATAVDKTW